MGRQIKFLRNVQPRCNLSPMIRGYITDFQLKKSKRIDRTKDKRTPGTHHAITHPSASHERAQF